MNSVLLKFSDILLVLSLFDIFFKLKLRNLLNFLIELTYVQKISAINKMMNLTEFNSSMHIIDVKEKQ